MCSCCVSHSPVCCRDRPATRPCFLISALPLLDCPAPMPSLPDPAAPCLPLPCNQTPLLCSLTPLLPAPPSPSPSPGASRCCPPPAAAKEQGRAVEIGLRVSVTLVISVPWLVHDWPANFATHTQRGCTGAQQTIYGHMPQGVVAQHHSVRDYRRSSSAALAVCVPPCPATPLAPPPLPILSPLLLPPQHSHAAAAT